MLRVLALLLLASAAWADQASQLYKQARRLEKEGDDLRAFAVLTRVIGMRPEVQKYQVAAERLRVRAAQSLAALGLPQQAQALDPVNRYLPAAPEKRQSLGPPPTDAELREAEQAAPPPELRPAPGPRSFHLRGDARVLYEQVFQAYGLNVVFDSDFTAGPPLRFQLDQVEFRDALHALMSVTGTFVVPLHERVALVAKDTQQKRTELEPTMAELLPIPQTVTPEEANEVGRAVQQVLDIRRLTVDPARRQVLVRDTVSRVRLARALYEELARSRGEIMLDVDLVSVSRETMANLGLTLPTAVPVTAGSRGPANLGGGETLFGIQVASAAFEADSLLSEARLLSRFQLRASDGLPASLHVGQRYPVANAIFSPIVITQQIQTLQQNGQLIQPFPSINFEDLGLVFKVTPRVHDSREVSLALEGEFRQLTGQSFNGVPVISDRKFSSSVRVREGEISIVSGLAVLRATRTRSGYAGLAQIPILGHLFRRDTWDFEQDDLLITITPHLMIPPPGDQIAQRTLYCGTETRIVSPL
jgi:general secretion pathway protein D